MTKKADFTPLPGFPINRKFTTLNEIHEYLHGEKITCLLCGRAYKSIMFHISKHGVSADEYKEKFGLPFRTGLTCASTKLKNKTNGERNSGRLVAMQALIDRDAQILATRNQRTSDFKRLKSKLIGSKAIGNPSPFEVDHVILVLKHMVDFDVSLANAIKATGIMSMTTFWKMIKNFPDVLIPEYEIARSKITKGKSNPLIDRMEVIRDIRGMRAAGISRKVIAEKYNVNVEYVSILERGYDKRYLPK